MRRADGVTNSTKVMITTVLTTKELCFAQMYQDNLHPLHVAYICDLEPAGWWFCAVASTVHLCTRVLTAIGCGGPQVTYHGCAQTLTTDRPLSSCSVVRLNHAAIDINIYIHRVYIYWYLFGSRTQIYYYYILNTPPLKADTRKTQSVLDCWLKRKKGWSVVAQVYVSM